MLNGFVFNLDLQRECIWVLKVTRKTIPKLRNYVQNSSTSLHGAIIKLNWWDQNFGKNFCTGTTCSLLMETVEYTACTVHYKTLVFRWTQELAAIRDVFHYLDIFQRKNAFYKIGKADLKKKKNNKILPSMTHITVEDDDSIHLNMDYAYSFKRFW